MYLNLRASTVHQRFQGLVDNGGHFKPQTIEPQRFRCGFKVLEMKGGNDTGNY